MKSKFTREQRAKIVAEAKNGSVSAVAKKYNTRACVIYNWISRGVKHDAVSTPKKPADKMLNEVAFLKAELEKRDKIILQFALEHFSKNL